LGCTELSLVKRDIPLGHGYLDALEVLSKRCVEACGAPLKEAYRQLIS
jgi:aspartate racemase